MKYFPYFLVFIFFCVGINKEILAQQDTLGLTEQKIMEIYTVENQNLEIFYKKHSIPKPMKKALKIKYGDVFCFSIANSGKNYRKNDVIKNPFIPSKQMLFLIRSGEYYALVFNKGGKGHSTHFVFCRIISKEIVEMKIYYIFKSDTVEDFLSEIQNQKFRPVKWLNE
ncbi:MAG: hypothetical protein FWH36_06910 [Lentimicrobiaceae bacterium]|nr:hypothetical protein [Lentimicrobiaceae bacterium]